MVRRAWPMLLGALCLLFSIIAARQNAADVAWIENEMVGTARWLQDNIPPDALLAVHDVGAVGYFDEHRIVDLAGLVSADVIPFIRDESRLSAYLDELGVQYLVTLPSFYPNLVSQRDSVYPAGGACIPSEIATMCVFRWK